MCSVSLPQCKEEQGRVRERNGVIPAFLCHGKAWGSEKKCLSQLVTVSPGSAQSKGLETGDKVKLLGVGG